MGELCFGAHARHARLEMGMLAGDVLSRIGNRSGTGSLHQLLEPTAIAVSG
jgi:hypothetical protein